MKKLTIVTICYNDPNLRQTCDSIVHQTWQDFEWIVIDGGSNPDTQKIWDDYKYRIDTFISEKDKGIYNAMNKGIKLAHGEYINFMNAGDRFYKKTTLQQVFGYLQNDAGVIYGDYQIKKRIFPVIQKKYCHDKFFWIYSTINHQSAFIKRDLFQKYGLYDETYKILADREKFTKLYVSGISFKHIPECITKYNTSGISSQKSMHTLSHQERNSIIDHYFSDAELQKAKKIIDKLPIELYGLEKLFSIKNSYAKQHKVITIFGIQFRIPRKKHHRE